MTTYFTTEEHVKLYVPAVTADVKLAQLQQSFLKAEFQLLRPHIGTATLAQLAGDTTPPELLELLRGAIGTMAARIYAGNNTGQLTANGPTRLGGATRAATPKELAAQVEQLERDAYAQLDAILIYLEEHPEQYPTWHGSPYCTILKRRLFTTADEFDRYAQGDVSRVRFKGLWPAIGAAELSKVRHLLGRELHERLVDEQGLVAHAELVDLLRTAVAGLACDDELMEEAAYNALDEARYYLYEHLADYPEFENSPCYVAPRIIPDDTNSFYNGL